VSLWRWTLNVREWNGFGCVWKISIDDKQQRMAGVGEKENTDFKSLASRGRLGSFGVDRDRVGSRFIPRCFTLLASQ
jgi:hypothetical protein